MAVAPGNKITQADMAALAALANSKATLPQYITPGNPSGGSRAYAFPDWAANVPAGAWAASTVFAAKTMITDSNGNSQQASGTGGTTGSTIPSWPAANAAPGVKTVDGTVAWVCVNTIQQRDSTVNPNWLTELNRLRGNLASLNLFNVLTPATTEISGPWPVPGPTDNFLETFFYYADTGRQESVTLTSEYTLLSQGFFITVVVMNLNSTEYTENNTIINAEASSNFVNVFSSYNEWTLVIGGNSALQVQGVFYITGLITRGSTTTNTSPLAGSNQPPSTTTTPDSTDPLSLIAISGNFPGTMSVSVIPTQYVPEHVLIAFTINETLAPGRYTIKLNTQVSASDTNDTVYDITAQSAVQTITTHTRVNFVPELYGFDDGLLRGALTLSFDVSGQSVFSGVPTSTITYTESELAVGIHNSKNILKINVPGDNIGIAAGFGSVNTPVDNSYLNPPYPQPTFGPERIYIPSLSISTSVAGFWSAFCSMVSNLNSASPASMPWNLKLHKSPSPYPVVNPSLLGHLAPSGVQSNSYAQSTPVELQSEPPSWLASTYFTAGFSILDSNGNFQQVTTAGTSAGTHPVWSRTLNASTTDGTVVWKCVKVLVGADTWAANAAVASGLKITDANGNTQTASTAGTTGATEPAWGVIVGGVTTDGTVSWTLTALCKPILPAVHRPLSVPRYPVYWQNETIPALIPPIYAGGASLGVWGAANQWNRNYYGPPNTYDPGWNADNMALGWFIYSVSINRIGTNLKNGALLPMQDAAGNPQQIAVTIGCMRSGAFVGFGTYMTGQTVQVLWPVFTSDALVYQCTERVDIHAVAIASGGAGISIGTNAAGYPICAAFVSDVEALLTLIT